MSDSTTHGNPCPDPSQFFGLDAGNSTTGAEGYATDHSTPPATTQHGQTDGLEPWGTSEQDTVDSNVPGGHPRSPQNGPSVAYTDPGSYLSGHGYDTLHEPVGEQDGTSHGDPFNDSFGVNGHSFGAVTRPDSHGNGNTDDDSGAGHGSAGTAHI